MAAPQPLVDATKRSPAFLASSSFRDCRQIERSLNDNFKEILTVAVGEIFGVGKLSFGFSSIIQSVLINSCANSSEVLFVFVGSIK
jgi:hypothetical protein